MRFRERSDIMCLYIFIVINSVITSDFDPVDHVDIIKYLSFGAHDELNLIFRYSEYKIYPARHTIDRHYVAYECLL